jgi:hypothetical protein
MHTSGPNAKYQLFRNWLYQSDFIVVRCSAVNHRLMSNNPFRFQYKRSQGQPYMRRYVQCFGTDFLFLSVTVFCKQCLSSEYEGSKTYRELPFRLNTSKTIRSTEKIGHKIYVFIFLYTLYLVHILLQWIVSKICTCRSSSNVVEHFSSWNVWTEVQKDTTILHEFILCTSCKEHIIIAIK